MHESSSKVLDPQITVVVNRPVKTQAVHFSFDKP